MNLQINGVSKRYKGNVWGLKNLTLNLKTGVLGLLGPNGAGKSTLMRIIATITRPTEGQVVCDGIDIERAPNKIRSILGYLPQDFGVYPHLNAVEFLSYLAAARGLTGKTTRLRIAQLLELVNMTDAQKRPLGSLSGGMKQRVGIAQALLNDPRLLIVDEPTAGLDPEERVRFRNLLADLSGERLVILSSHIVSDIEATAGNIAVINRGKLIRHSSPEELIRGVEGKVWETTVASAGLGEMRQCMIISSTVRSGDGVRVRVVSEKSPGAEAREATPSLEDAYLYLLAGDRGDAN